MGPGQQAMTFQNLQVTADGVPRDAEHGSEFGDGHMTFLTDEIDQPPLP
jgi:hypothetical protein